MLASLLYLTGFTLASLASSVHELQVYIGLVCGTASCLVFMAGVVAVGQHFSSAQRALAYGLTASGSGLGTTVMAQFNTHMIISYGWKHTLFINSIVYVVAYLVIGFVYSMRESTVQSQAKQQDVSPRSTWELITDKIVMLMMLNVGVGVFGYQIPYSNIVSEAVWFDAEVAVLVGCKLCSFVQMKSFRMCR